MKGKNGKNFGLIGSVYFSRCPRAIIIVVSLWHPISEGGDGDVKNGVDARFCKVYFGEYDHNSENEGKYRIMSVENPLGKTSPCWIIPSPNIRCLKWFSVPNKVYLTKFPCSVYQSPGDRKSSRTFKKRFSPSPHTQNVLFHDSQK